MLLYCIATKCSSFSWRMADEPSGTVEIYKMEESEEEDAVLIGVGSPEEAGTQH